MIKILSAACVIFLIAFSVMAEETVTISGHITDASSGEALYSASYQIVELKKGGLANEYGFYSATIPPGSYTMRYSYIGYNRVDKQIEISEDTVIDIELEVEGIVFDEVVVKEGKKDRNVISTEMGTTEIKPEEIREVPVLFGEQDIIKTIQLLPGISETAEGSSGFFVRGGNPDQNLVILDEAPVYNASHFFGFFSVFNSDAIRNVTMIKGAAPAKYGGRLSSVMDIRMKEGNNKKFRTQGGIGLIFSRLTIEGPLKKDRGSFIVSGRRTYADIFLKLAKNENLKKSQLYFYDLNAKANYRLGKRDRLFLSGYFGRDLMGYSNEFSFDWGNATGTARWNHIFTDRLFLNSTLLYSTFDYVITIEDSGEKTDISSGIKDISLKEDFQYFIDPKNTLEFGVSTMHHRFTPGRIEATEGSNVNTYKIKDKHAYDSAFYIGHEYGATEKLKFNYGLRMSIFNVVGPGEVFQYDDDGNVIDEKNYKSNELIKSYNGLEPRFLANYILDDHQSVKFSYARNRQYMHLLSNTTAGTPLDIWHPSTNIVKPGTADQVSGGYFRNLKNNEYDTSFELYYKDLKDQTDYKNGANILLNKHVESELVFGKGWAYGAEYYIKKKRGRLTGWFSYTLGETRRKFKEINDGRPYPSKYDRKHDLSITGIYKFRKKWTFSASWIFHTGNAVTFPSGKYMIDGMTVNYYTERNGYRMPNYHRLDLGATWMLKKTDTKESNINFSLYNAYGRKNAYAILFRENEDNPEITEAVKLTLFTFFPSITYNFKF